MNNDTSVQVAGPALHGAGAACRTYRPAPIGRIAILGVLVTPGLAVRVNQNNNMRSDGADLKGGS
jgi:hypothetical protein